MVKQRYHKILYFIALTVVLSFLIFSNNGLLKFYQLNKDLSQLKKQISEANTQIKLLDRQIDSLKHSTIKLEQVAREKYRMKYDYEIPIRVKTK